jgi:hypothetical protein
MSTAKFEKLIDLIINEDHERAEQLFHDIVVEKSRTIYESLMDEDMTSGLTDEVSAEEDGMDGMMGEDDEFETDEVIDGDYDVDGDDFGDDEGIEGEIEMDADELGADEDEAGIEDRVVDLEDKLDELMAEFESMMAGEEGEESYDDEEFDDGEEEYDAGEEEEEEGEDEEEDSGIMENIDLKQVPGLYGSKISQDSPDGSKKGPVDANSGQKGMASKPVNFVDGGTETMPSKPAKPTGYAAKGEKEQPLAGKYQNRPNANPTVAKTGKGESVGMQYGDTKSRAQGKEAGAGGSVKQDNKSVIESRRTTKRRV